MRRCLAAVFVLFAAWAATASASEETPTLAELEREVVCPTCHTTLALSSSPVAERMRAFVRERIAAGDTKSEIKRKLIADFGEGVLAAPPARGFNLLVWVLPAAGTAVGGIVLALLAVRWRRTRADSSVSDPAANGRPPLDLELERRLDEELARFDA